MVGHSTGGVLPSIWGERSAPAHEVWIEVPGDVVSLLVNLRHLGCELRPQAEEHGGLVCSASASAAAAPAVRLVALRRAAAGTRAAAAGTSGFHKGEALRHPLRRLGVPEICDSAAALVVCTRRGGRHTTRKRQVIA